MSQRGNSTWRRRPRNSPSLPWQPVAVAVLLAAVGLALLAQGVLGNVRNAETRGPTVTMGGLPARDVAGVESDRRVLPAAFARPEPRDIPKSMAKCGPAEDLARAKPTDDADEATIARLSFPAHAPRAVWLAPETSNFELVETPADIAACDKSNSFGTALTFERNAVEAGERAEMERKLMFILHVSGDFEDTAFT